MDEGVTDSRTYAVQLEAQDTSVDPSSGWLAQLTAKLDSAPLPANARRLAGKVLDEALPNQLIPRAAADPAKLSTVLYALCGVAPFFANILARHPEHLIALLDDDLTVPRSPEDLRSQLEQSMGDVRESDDAERLRVFKYRELARITVRDCSDHLVPLPRSAETLRELSELADALLERALLLAEARIATQLEPPAYVDDEGTTRPLRFCVLGLGKLGAGELNYSSDVDLVYVCDALPTGADARGSSPMIYFDKLAQEFGSIVAASLQEGFLYRVDLDLRPNGTQGALVVTESALISYYESWALTWEKAAFMKARPVAGSLDLGWHAIVAAAPAIYNATMNYRMADGIHSLKEKIRSARGGDADSFDVKIDAGGIRDVEFIAQALQLLHAGRIPQLRDRSTQGALRNLEAVGLLESETAAELNETYLFLRRIENRLQMEGERQIHRLPKSADGLARLARAMGYLEEDGATRLQADIASRRKFLGSLATDSLGKGNQERIKEIVERAVPKLFQFGMTNTLLHQLIERFAQAFDDCGDADRALNNLDRSIRGAGNRRNYFELLLDRPEIVPRLAALYSASNFLSDYLARYPRLIESLFRDPNTLLYSDAQLRADHDRVLAERSDDGEAPDLELRLDALRSFHHLHVLNVGLLDLAKKSSRAESEGALTNIAEICIENALEISRDELAARKTEGSATAPPGKFLVVGMGKLASRELTYGSDVDLIFIYNPASEKGGEAMAQDYFVRLAQRFISALQTPTRLGFCYEVDARLRPSGNQGVLVCSMASYRRYHADTAATWERQALLRSRPVAGDASLADEFETLRLEILTAPNPESLAGEIHHVRSRMEEELAKETARHFDYKTGRGGVLDVECAVQYLQLLHGSEHTEILESAPIDSQRIKLAELGLINADCARILKDGWSFLQELGSRLRIVENRSISSLDVDKGDLDTLARHLGYNDDGEGTTSRALQKDYGEVTESIRSVYLEVMGI